MVVREGVHEFLLLGFALRGAAVEEVAGYEGAEEGEAQGEAEGGHLAGCVEVLLMG